MLNMRFIIAGFLCVAAAGADAQSFEQQLFQFSRHAAATARHSREDFKALNAQASAVPAQAEWRKVRGDYDAFTVDMPAAPSYSKRVERVEDVGVAKYEITMFSHAAEDRGRFFFIDTAFFPAEMDYMSDSTHILTWMVFVEKLLDNKKWSKINWTNHQGRPAVDAVAFSRGEEVRFFITFRGRQLFSLSCVGPAGTVRSADADRFIGSLNIR